MILWTKPFLRPAPPPRRRMRMGLEVAVLADEPSVITSHRMRPQLSTNALRSCGHIVHFSREQGPGEPRRFIGERDNRSIEASPRRKPLQPLGTTVVVLRQSKHHRAGAVDHLSPEIMIGASANAAEPGFPASRILTRHQADPCREFPPRAKMTSRRWRGGPAKPEEQPQAKGASSPRHSLRPVGFANRSNLPWPEQS
jgi:hypothetical protein